ncbi:MAG: CDP-glycerol glycerophosphotransferase family protein, partial [Bacteroidia bacterium]|nr:CDP-glycerol glycerophosphotransferase family protein [Bacteroidia bacterium]
LFDVNLNIFENYLLHFHRATLRDICKTIDLGNTAGDTYWLDKFTPLARFLVKAFGRKRVNSLIYFLYKILSPAKSYKSQFLDYKPDLVIVTRVLNYSKDYPILRMADKLKVPAISLVSSWDNLTSKGFYSFSINKIVVWNNVLKEEAMSLFGYPEKDIFVSGIPRYDSFFNYEPKISKKEYCLKMGLDPNKKIILYGTGSATTGRTSIDLVSPEPEIADFIVDNINNGKIENAQLIVRLHPQAEVNSYEFLKNKLNLVLQIPGKSTSFQDRLFSKTDDDDFANTLYFSDVVVNLGSTISIDAAVFDKPIICIFYDFRGLRPFEKSVKRLYHFDHYHKLLKTNGIKLSDSNEVLIEDINTYLNNPKLLVNERFEMVKQQCFYTDGKSGERVADFLINYLS